MKIDLLPMEEFISLNELKEVTSPIVFQRGNVPDPYGLLSMDIFGLDVRSRKNRFAYISLNGHFFHPHVFKAFKRLYRNIDRIVAGTENYSINENGQLVKDEENGETGIEFIYKNWSKIKWEVDEDTSSMRKERIDLLKLPKDQLFVKKMVVIPVFYRDISTGGTSGGGETDPLNNLYSKLIRLAGLLENRDMFDFTLHATEYSIQNILVEIYDTFKHKIEKKNGMIRKFLMGKNVDNCARSVISCPLYHENTPEDALCSFGQIGVPLSQICSLASPFMMRWLKEFFEREFITNQYAIPAYLNKNIEEQTNVQLYKPELYFTDKYIEKMMERYIADPEFRFDPIMAPIDKDKYVPVVFKGKQMDPSGTHELSTISNRYLTVTDVLYMAAVDVIKPMHALITRYPVSDVYGLFVAKPSAIATLRTEVVQINGQVYKHYPRIDTTIKRHRIAIRFVDTLQFSNSYLDGLGGDYDGDQVTIKLLWSMEANKECAKFMDDKVNFISPDGSNVRKIKYEVYQTFYDMTRPPRKGNRVISNDEKKFLLTRDPENYDFTFLTEIFADRVFEGRTRKSQFEPNDIVKLDAGEYHNQGPIETTVGRIVWNKIMIDRVGMRSFFPAFNNEVLTKKEAGKYEQALVDMLRADEIGTPAFRRYIDHRDWLGLQLNGLITTSFTSATIQTPKKVQTLRNDLFKKYEKELNDGDIVTANKIEKELIDATIKEIGDDPGFDLYNSGARGDINNHLKNLFLMRGGVLNPNTGKYEIMKTAFSEGLRKEDFTAASNSVVQGAYPKAKAL